ncbi:hypothetical protein BDV36DRAFT_46499 [Aspergillus pseudocaelatus]|uniref:Uncharacterized protein n=1 Tax=Aspergillus pseudocaelatus TaxID=1825620 RepID=A0ABQ6W6W4_9EURO|nr:hypothetical protein BDV36DRAFT_46499 [Aspergillus pseudocaelatus]
MGMCLFRCHDFFHFFLLPPQSGEPDSHHYSFFLQLFIRSFTRVEHCIISWIFPCFNSFSLSEFLLPPFFFFFLLFLLFNFLSFTTN